MSETDAQLRKALLALVPRDGADWQDVLARATRQSIPRCRVAATQAITAKRTSSRRRLVRNGALVVLSAAVAAASISLVGPFDGSRGGLGEAAAATEVRTLHAFSTSFRDVREENLPAPVQEFIHDMGRRYGRPTRIQQPIVGQPSVYLVTLNNQDLCSAVVLGSGLSGSCYDALRQGDGSIEANVEIVGGRLFVSGLAANNVTGVSVSEAVTDRTPASTSVATLMHNVYVAAIPYSGGGSGEITVKVERSDAPSVTVSVAAVPAPPGSRSGH